MRKDLNYKVGKAKVYPELQEIRFGDTVVRVQKKTMDVLWVLMEHQGQVVKKEAMFRTVWGKTIVSENSLTKCISELRKVFGDTREAPGYIQTIPKTGYRLLPSVIPMTESRMDTLGRVSHRKGLLGLLTFLVFSLAGFWLWIQYDTKGMQEQKLISPSGEKVLRTRILNDSLWLTVEDVRSKAIIRQIGLPEPEHTALAWGPDSNRLVYNATMETDEYYSVCVYHIVSNHTMFLRFAKPGKELLVATSRIDSLKEFVSHQEIGTAGTRVEFMEISERDTVKMLMEGKRIVGFEW